MWGNLKQKFYLRNILITLLMLFIAATCVLPFIWMISASLKVEADVFKYPIEWIPSRWNVIQNYSEIWQGKYNFALYYWNSIKIAVLATILQVIVSAMGAYGFAKVRFKFSEQLFLLYLATMMIPEQITLIPRFFLVKWVGLYDTHISLVMMLSFSVYGIFLLRQFMVTIPESLSESAKIDGASHFRIFLQIILPMAKPAIATLAILKFVWTWNDYQNPLVFLNSKSLFTVQLGMRQFATDVGTYYSLVMAAAVCSIIPLLIIFILGQKQVIEGITLGAVKG